MTKLDETGQPQKVSVKTGTTTVDRVEILEGIEAGDKLVVGAVSTASFRIERMPSTADCTRRTWY